MNAAPQTVSPSRPLLPLLPTSAGSGALVVGAAHIAEKEQLVLRSLVRLLDRQAGLRLHCAERLGDSHVIFAPPGWEAPVDSRQALIVRVLAGPGEGSVGGTEPVIVAPLRMSNVTALLQTCAARLANASAAATVDVGGGLPALFPWLARDAVPVGSARELLTLADGRALVLDHVHDCVHSPLSQPELLAGHYRLAEARPLPALGPTGGAVLPLRELVWAAAHRLGAEGAPSADLPGRYRLLRWPDATALARPGFPRLAALWNSRCLGVAEASAASGIDLGSVQWFLGACLRLGIAAPDQGSPTPADPSPLAEPGGLRVVLSRLRERFKLW